MADPYVPPVSPAVNFTFKPTPSAYVPPASTTVDFTFGAEDDDGQQNALLRSNFTILLTM